MHNPRGEFINDIAQEVPRKIEKPHDHHRFMIFLETFNIASSSLMNTIHDPIFKFFVVYNFLETFKYVLFSVIMDTSASPVGVLIPPVSS